MKSTQLRIGQTVKITAGRWQGYEARIVDTQTLSDGQPHARCVPVHVLGVEPDGSGVDDYVLPRYMEPVIYREVAQSFAPPAPPQPALASALMNTVVEPSIAHLDDFDEVVEPERITDPMHPVYDCRRPDWSVLDRYIRRNIGGMTDIDYFLRKRQQKDGAGYSIPLGLLGETQSGKTMFVQALACAVAKEEGYPKPMPVFTVMGSSGLDIRDVFGGIGSVIDPRTNKDVLVWMDGIINEACACGGILYLDELFSMTASQAPALYSLLDERHDFENHLHAVPNGYGRYHSERVVANKNLWVLTTANPAGYKGVQAVPEAMLNRIDWHPWDYDEAVEKVLIPSSTIRLLGEALRTARSTSRVLSTPVGTSALRRLNENIALFGADVAITQFYGMFTITERDKVQAIIEDRGILDLLAIEYPQDSNTPTTTTVEESE